ncbi:MAG: hypothetical protein J6E42_10075 [Firmicutes bacterium]|nr:hypothetical protein [Bacillota bacterium]
MRWKVSCSELWRPGFSPALLKENFRRFWSIPMLAFLFYFLSGPFMVLMNYGQLQNERYFIQNMLCDNNLGFVILHVLVPVVSAVMVFRYLQQPGTVTTAHALPFSRSTLFNTNFLSGLLMSALPVLANGLILLVLRRPVYAAYYEGESLPLFTQPMEHADFPDGAYDAFSAGSILQWLMFALLTVLFFYAITVFAGVVTGISLLHFGFGLWFNFMMPILWLCMFFYFDLLLFGFNDSGSIQNAPLYMHPLLYHLSNGSSPTLYMIVFLLIAIVVVIAAKWFYLLRPMERAGDALTFRFMQPLLCFLMAFIAMTLLGLYFDQSFGSAYAVVGMIFGAVLGFIIGRMIVLKTLQIFNRSTVKSFAAFAAIAAALFSSVSFDIFGYEQRVPQSDSIQSAYFPMENIFSERFSLADINSYDDADSFPYLTDIHRELIEQRYVLENAVSTKTTVSLTYTLNNGWTSARRYRIPYDYLYQSEALRAFYNSPSFRRHIEEAVDSLQDVTFVQIYNYVISDLGGPSSDSFYLYPNEYDLNSFWNAVKEDMLDTDYAQAILDSPALFYIEATAPAGSGTANGVRFYFRQAVTPQMSHTLTWLADHGICDPFNDLLDKTAAILVTPEVTDWNENEEEMVPQATAIEMAEKNTYGAPLSGSDLELSLSETDQYDWDGDSVYVYDPQTDTMKPGSLKQIRSDWKGSYLVTDPEDIRQLLSWSETCTNYGDDYFQLTCYFKEPNLSLHNTFGTLYMAREYLAMDGCDFTPSPQLASFMNDAF